MGEKGKREFSLDDILEEQRKKREEQRSSETIKSTGKKTSAPQQQGTASQKTVLTSNLPSKAPRELDKPNVSPGASTMHRDHLSNQSTAQRVSSVKRDEAKLKTSTESEKESVPIIPSEKLPLRQQVEETFSPTPKSESAPAQREVADLNQFVTGSPPASRSPESQQEEKKKKKKGGFFGRKKNKVPDFDENEETVYGLQLKPIDEYRRGFNAVTGEFSISEESYASLFDDSKRAIDDEVEKNFLRLQQERRARVEQAVKSSGVDKKEIEEELGIVAPMPVSSFSADPYTKQHGLDIEGKKASDKLTPDFQRAQLETLKKGETMEIKLNVLNDTVELQRISDEQLRPAENKRSAQPAVIADTAIEHVLKQAPEAPRKAAGAPAGAKARPEAKENKEELQATTKKTQAQSTPKTERPDLEKRDQNESKQAPSAEGTRTQQGPLVRSTAPTTTIDPVTSIFEYRMRGLPTHVIRAEIMLDALEAHKPANMQKTTTFPVRKAQPAQQAGEDGSTRPFTKTFTRLSPDTVEQAPPKPKKELLEDYTEHGDSRSISSDLRADMHDLTLRMTVTAICTIVLTFINIIFKAAFNASGEDPGSSPFIFTLLTLVFFMVSVGICFRTVANGLKSLLSFQANSDSGVAIASVGVLIQIISCFFFKDQLFMGHIHPYAVVLTALLFVNSLGKLTMLRRIHSNFRFVSSKEQKYAVQLYDDHNTAIQMAKNIVMDNPVIAYQCKASFLRRFLEFSFKPDPAEISSQMLAPIGLIASLLLCLVTLILSESVSAAISTFSAALLACVAASNMLSVNLPVSRLAKLARRGGAMVVGYEAVEMGGSVNAIMVDADDIFPKGTVVLNGIKTYGNRSSVEEAILCASSLVNKVGGPLTGVFEQVITENEDSLPEVERFAYEDGCGINGWVDGKKIYIGNRKLMQNRKIQSPALDDESQYSVGNKQVVYIAMDLSIIAMMIITYSADRRKKNELTRLEDNGVSLLIRTTDANITPVLVSKLFGIDKASVSILTAEQGGVYASLTGHENRRCDAIIATKGRIESMLTVISACVSVKRDVGLTIALQTLAVILGFILVAFLACFGAISRLSSFGLFFFELIWLALILVLPKLRSR